MPPKSRPSSDNPRFDFSQCQILQKNGHCVLGIGLTMPERTQTRLYDQAPLDTTAPVIPPNFLKDADPESGINIALLLDTPLKRAQSYLALCSNCLNGRNGTCPRLEPAIINNGKNGGKKAKNERYTALVFKGVPEV